MRKMKKLASYLILLAIPVAIAVALFVFNGSGYRLSCLLYTSPSPRD